MQPIDEFFVQSIKNNNLELLKKFAQAIAFSVVNDLVDTVESGFSADTINELNRSLQSSILTLW